MGAFPAEAPKARVLPALARLGFNVLREREHIILLRVEADGTRRHMTIPNHPHLKAPTLRSALSQAGVDRTEFLSAFEEA